MSTSFTLIFVVGIGLIGTLIGSFLNVVIYRVPRDESVVSPPSACPTCGHRIRSVDNIPIVSWVVLRGRCRDCRAPISIRYPLVELGTAVFFALVAGWAMAELAAEPLLSIGAAELVGLALSLLAFLYLAAASIALAMIDLETHRLPNKIVLPSYGVGAILLGAAALLTADYDRLLGAGIGLAAMWLAYFLMAILYPGGMGFGDVKLAGVLGLFLGWLGWGPLIIGSFSAFLLGGVFALLLLVARRVTRKGGIPFGPWMLVGAWVGIFAGDTLWSSYLGMFGLA
jgi:leader peptidase (prepilin peptidase)/N-methyltransferase